MARAVNGVRGQAHHVADHTGATNSTAPVTNASAPIAAMVPRETRPSRASPGPGPAAYRRLASQAAATRNGAVKYRPAQSQKATLPWLNRSQWMMVAMASRVAKRATAAKPACIAAQRFSRSTRRKK